MEPVKTKPIKTNLQEMRKRAGYKSAREFAESIGMSVGTYTNYEQCKANMSLVQAWEFADILNCTLDELAGRRPPEQPSITPNEHRLLDVYRDASSTDRDIVDMVIDTAARHIDEQAKNKERIA